MRPEHDVRGPSAPKSLAGMGAREARHSRVFEPHVAPLNRLVEEINTQGRQTPWVDPSGGGIEARILFLLESPGPKSSSAHGSGIISMDNADPSAARMWRLTRETGLTPEECLSWNAVPWYVSETAKNENATPKDFREAEVYLARFVALSAGLKVVVLMGAFAERCWVRYLRRHDSVVLPVVVAPHPGERSRLSRPSFEEDIRIAMMKASRVGRSGPCAPRFF